MSINILFLGAQQIYHQVQRDVNGWGWTFLDTKSPVAIDFKGFSGLAWTPFDRGLAGVPGLIKLS